jgi:uncharacterized protein YbbC (DUF1343 family)
VGVRFYTYPATVAWLLKACANAGKPVILLDRPNPLGGHRVEGAGLEKRFVGHITSFYPTSMIHGMTLGELAVLYNRELNIGADLTTVPLEGWYRNILWNETELPWIAPSPALTTPEQALLYGALGALEALNIAVGRSLDNHDAFHVYGAPWITASESSELAHKLSTLGLAGLKFTPTQWVPTRSEFVGQQCRGFRIDVTDAHAIEPFRSLLDVLKTMRAILGSRLDTGGLDGSLGKVWVRHAIEDGLPTNQILSRAYEESATFLAKRERALLYR